MSKEEIFEKHSMRLQDNYGDGFDALLIEEANKAMDEYAKEVAIGFCEWAVSEGWQHYDGHDRWINLENGRTVLETKQLYQQYLNQKGV